MTATPDDAVALEIGRLVLRLAGLLGLSAPAPAVYSADSLPPGTTRDAFLRRHRQRLREGVPGWSRVGHGRLVTVDAWAADVAAETEVAAQTARARRRSRTPPPANDTHDTDEEQLDADLGIRPRRASR